VIYQPSQAIDSKGNLKTPSLPLNHQPGLPTRMVKGFGCGRYGVYRRFYRQKPTPFTGAGNGAICGAATLSTPLSTSVKDTGEPPFLPACYTLC
jgi:hypothetical protein